MIRYALCLALAVLSANEADANQLLAGVAKVDITDYKAGPVNDPLYVKALLLKSGDQTVAIITVDAVAIGEIGRIKNDYLPAVRKRLQDEMGIAPSNVIVNASHCHGVVMPDIADHTLKAVKEAASEMTPVTVGVGVGHEDRIMENRRLKLKDGRTIDVRHAYSLPPDDEIEAVGPIDPQIGLLRLDRVEGGTLAVVYNFACHPIQGVPSGGNTADIVGFASRVIEENLEGDTMALFLQGCGGDVNPVFYKDVDHPRDAEPLGTKLGLSALKGLREIECVKDTRLSVKSQRIDLPRGDRSESIIRLESKQQRLLQSIRGTSLNLKTFLPLVVKYNLSEEFPTYYSHRYLHDDALGRTDLRKLDADNRQQIKAYIQNIYVMEELSRVRTNLALLKKHQASFIEAASRHINIEISGIRIGKFVLLTFPGELTVQIGQNLKQNSPHKHTFVAGYTNGYIYYAPTAKQLKNVGNAQEDSDCILAPEWQATFESKAIDLLGTL